MSTQPREIPRDEMIADYTATADDQGRLTVIVDALSAFIANAHGEDRSAYRIDLMRYESLLDHAKQLKATIGARIDATPHQSQDIMSQARK